MAESPVNFLIGKLATLFNNEVNLLGGVHEEVLCLRGELERMRAFLRIADAYQESDEELSIWVKQVRDIAHETEDLLAEYTLLQGHDHGTGFYGSLCRLACCIRNVKACYRIAADLKSINLRLRKINEVHKRLRHKFSKVEQGLGSAGGLNPWEDRRNDALLLEKSDLVGIDERKKQLVGWLIKGGSGREVISLAGQGGMGKTTLAKQVYDDAEVKKHFKVRAWITVSQSSQIEDLLKDMVEQINKAIKRRVPPAADNMSNNQLKTTIKELLQRRKYLIVLDDVWQLHSWRAVQYALPNNGFGSRVVLTTRNTDVACTARKESDGKTYNLEPLSPSESWDLLCKKTFQGNSCPFHLEEMCRYILKRCEGLPLAIVAISGVLATKDTQRIDEWDVVARSLGAEIDGNDKLKDLKKILSLSFNDLPYYLKSCFLYFSIFPEDHLIERARLIRMWIAEGFIEAKEGKVLEEVADDYLTDLLNRSLIQVATTTSDGRARTFRIHDLLREIIISKSRDQNFATVLKGQNVQWSDRARRLSVHYTLLHLQPNRSVSQLRSLFMFEVIEKLRLHTLFPGGFRLLTLLGLDNSNLKKFPVEVVNLCYLKYLSLRNTKVKIIPRFIGKLHNLETLDLKYSQVTELPVEILKLQRLRHLLLYRNESIPRFIGKLHNLETSDIKYSQVIEPPDETQKPQRSRRLWLNRNEFVSHELFNSQSGFRIMANIGVLQSLQKLCFIEVNPGCSNLVKELGNLTQLRRLGILKLRREDGRVLCSSIEKMSYLRALSIVSIEEDEIVDLQHLSTPPALLQRLYITGRLEMLPYWIPSLQNLVKLSLKWSKLKDDPLVYLQYIPNLVYLVLCQAFTGHILCFRAGGFKKLKILGLDEFDELKCIQVEPGAMVCLESLSIRWCKSLEKIPAGIEHLTKLKLLEFFDMPMELFNTLRPDVKDSEYWRVAHIPEVYSTYWRDGEWKVYSLESMSDGENCPMLSTS